MPVTLLVGAGRVIIAKLVRLNKHGRQFLHQMYRFATNATLNVIDDAAMISVNGSAARRASVGTC
jgi:hypothetical protein